MKKLKLQVNLPLRDRSLFITLGVGGGGEALDTRGDHLIFGRTKGSISPNSAVIQRGGGTTQICLENEDMEWGSRKSSKVIRGDHFSEVTFKGGIC